MFTELHAAWRVFIGLKKNIFDIKNTFSRFPTYTMQPQRPAGEEPSRPRGCLPVCLACLLADWLSACLSGRFVRSLSVVTGYAKRFFFRQKKVFF